MKKRALFFTACVIAIGLERLYSYQHGGFSVKKITSHLSDELTSPYATSEISPEVCATLKQDFHFLGSGGTCFAFLGEDKKTVLKLFKHHHLTKKSALVHKQLPFLFTSCKLAFDDLKEETGLIYLSLRKNSPLNMPVTLIDKWGMRRIFDLKDTEFAVQKYATPLFSFLQEHIHNLESCKTIIDSLLLQIETRARKQIGDRDPNLHINYGVVDGRVIELDIGSFFKYPGKCARFTIGQELFFSTYALQKWLENTSPELLYYTQEKIVHAMASNTD